MGKNKGKFLASMFWTSSFNYKVLKNAEDYLHSEVQVGQKMSRNLWVNFYPSVPHNTRKIKPSARGLVGFIHAGNVIFPRWLSRRIEK